MFTGQGLSMSFMGSFSKAWLGAVIVFFVVAIVRRWIGEEMDFGFNFIIGEALGIVSYIIAMSVSCSSKIALVVGLAFGLGGGFLGGRLIEFDLGGE